MKHLQIRSWSVPIAILAVSLLAFGLLIPWLGFYQDDWYQMWFERTFGTGIWPAYYARERPFIAALYMLTTPFLGTTPLGWQIFALFTRWLSAFAVWQTLRQIWPKHSQQVAWIALLFAVYPGFRQQYAAVIYSHYFLQLTIHLASFAAMAIAIKKPRRFWPMTIFSLAAALFSLFTSEYFFGLELMRPILILILTSDQSRSPWLARLKQTLARWWPYLAATIVFLLWRVVVFKFPTYQPVFLQSSQSALLSTIRTLASTILHDIFEMGVYAWLLPLRLLPGLADLQPSSMAALVLALAGFLLAAVYLLRYRATLRDASPSSLPTGELQPPSVPPDSHFAAGLLALGLVGLFGAGIPFWFVGLPIDTGLNSGSRFGISFMLPASFLLVGILEALVSWQPRSSPSTSPRASFGKTLQAVQIWVIAGVIGLAVGHHFKDANYYRQVHRSQATFFQQLAWRAPGLKPGTLILTNTFEEVLLSGDNSLTAALNWIYDPRPPYSLDYMLFYIPSRIESKNLTSLEKGLPVVKEFRTTRFTGTTSEALVIYYDPPHCLRVLDPEIDLGIARPVQMPSQLKDAVVLSNLEQILPGASQPALLPGELFKYRPDSNSWCFFYEKADLARQQRDWNAIISLGAQAIEAGYESASTWEQTPFIEGYARGGQIERAQELTYYAYEHNTEAKWLTREILCAAWSRIGRDSKQSRVVSAIQAVEANLGCE